MNQSLVIKNQWDDFLIRSSDPYANAKYEILIEWLGNLETKKILVVGSGSGELVVMLATLGGKLTAIDISEKYVDLTKQTIEHAKLKDIFCQVSTLENFKSNSKFDIVIATDVIEHIEDDRAAFRQCLNHLVKGGRLVITVPSLQILYGYHDEILGHYRRYSKTSFKELIPSDIKTLQLRYFGFLFIPIALVISRILRISYPVAKIGQQQKKSVFGFLIKLLFLVEKKLAPPLGTSLLYLGQKK